MTPRFRWVFATFLLAACTSAPAVTPAATTSGSAPSAATTGAPAASPSQNPPQHSPTPGIPLPPAVELKDAGATAFEIAPDPDFLVVANGDAYGSGIRAGIGKVAPNGSVTSTWAVPGDSCAAMDVGFGAVWSATCKSPGLVRIDTKTDVLTQIAVDGSLPTGEASIGVGEGGVWLIRQGIPAQLVKVDPKTNKVVKRFDMPGSPTAVRVGLGAVWVVNPSIATVLRVDPKTGAVTAEIKVGAQPQFFAVGEGAVWTMNQRDGTVSRIDPANNSVVATIQLGSPVEGGDIAVGGGFVWLRGNPVLLYKIDPATNQIVAVYGPNAGSGSVAADDDAVWISAHDIRTIWRLPLH